jgi:hypothetical protein
MPSSTAGQIRDGRDVIGRFLSRAETDLLAVLAEQRGRPDLTDVTDRVPELDQVLAPVLEALRHAAAELGTGQAESSGRHSALAVVRLLWCDLVELEPDRLRRTRGTHDLPPWPQLYAGLLAALTTASDRLERDAPGRPRSG